MTEVSKTQDGPDKPKEISLFALLSVLTGQKKIIFGVAAISAIVAVAIAVFSTPFYSASATLTVVPADNAVNASAVYGRAISSLASLGGGSLAGGNDAEYIATMRSRVVTNRFITDNDLLPILFADRWDAESKSWKDQTPIWPIRMLKNLLRLASGEPEATTGDESPSLWMAHFEFEKIRTVAVDPESGIVTLTIEWTDPKVAAEWANKLVEATNLHIRLRAGREATANIAFLRDQAQKTSIVPLKNALYNLIEKELQAQMLSAVRQDFAFKVIDPAVVPKMRARPKRVLIVMTGFIIGLLAGGLIVLFRQAYAEDRSRRP